MADPHLDLAMFSVYSAFDSAKLDHLIDLYFESACPPETRIKIYCYAAACGLLWSNWCEYKSSLGVEFGEYSLQQYRAAKTYARLAAREIRKLESRNTAHRNHTVPAANGIPDNTACGIPDTVPEKSAEKERGTKS